MTDVDLVGFLIQVFPCKNHCHNHQFTIAAYFAFFLFMVKFEDTITIVIQLMHSLMFFDAGTGSSPHVFENWRCFYSPVMEYPLQLILI